MSRSSPDCTMDRRRHEVRRRGLNGLDYLEVSDDQRSLTVYFLGSAPEDLTADNVTIAGGRRITGIRVTGVKVCPQVDPELDNCMVVSVDRPGDFSTYRLCLVGLPPDTEFDPRYRCLEFSFKASCPSDLDCRGDSPCPPEPGSEPEISYLAKDFASLRRLMFDRLAVTLPEWTDRHVPDLGVTLVELLAYAGDRLSYAQDAVATEAYLDTARQRISVRRHARLVDYHLGEGCNARAWVQLETSSDVELAADRLAFLTGFDGAPEVADRLLGWEDLREVPASAYEVFEPLLDPEAESGGRLRLFTAHNEIHFYTWGDGECCLPRGATSATLVDGAPLEPGNDEPLPAPKVQDPKCDPPDPGGDPVAEPAPERELQLEVGDVLIFEEVLGPRTGNPADADPARRHAVRLTAVEERVDELHGQPLLEVAWDADDALPFELCLTTLGPPPNCATLEHVSVARGNVVLADHGRRHGYEPLGCVDLAREETPCLGEGQRADPVREPCPFRPRLGSGPLTFGQPLEASLPAVAAVRQDPEQALPWIRLRSRPDHDCPPNEGPEEGDASPWESWTARADLLSSLGEDRHYVAEMDDAGRAHLRFGNGDLGRRPEAGEGFEALYRTGNGPAGNVGAEALSLVVSDESISGVDMTARNPLPASGGTAPQPIAEAKLFAPHAVRQEIARAVTPADYARLAQDVPGVQRAAAELRWNGSWYEVRVAVDALGQAEAGPELLAEVERHLRRYRRIGHDLALLPARHVPIDLGLWVCVREDFLRAHVRSALLKRFGTARLRDGTPGFFHPDALTFGTPLSLSRIVAAAQAVRGVESVEVTRLERLFEGPAGELEAGVLTVGPLEVARLDNDPNEPENGCIRIELGGGR